MRFLLATIFTLLGSAVCSAELPKKTEQKIDSIIISGLQRGYYPSASIIVGSAQGIKHKRCFGEIDSVRKVDFDDLYDIASCTKIVATTFAIMRLYDEKKIDLNAKVGRYTDLYRDNSIDKISISQLLTHTSGLKAVISVCRMLFENTQEGELISSKYDEELYPKQLDANLYYCAQSRAKSDYISYENISGYRQIADSMWVNPAVDTLVLNAVRESHVEDRKGRYRYSDLNFYILRQIIESITKESFADYTGKLFTEIGMTKTGFNPRAWYDSTKIVPTEYDHFMNRGLIVGYPHDEMGLVANGMAEGNAGLFSTVDDLSKFAMMLLNNGRYDGKQIIKPSTISLFTSRPLASRKIYRGLGFDGSKPNTPLFGGFGHTGYTGTIIWINKRENRFMIFLSNRVSPTRLNRGLASSKLRTLLWEEIVANR